jgi:predicted nucleic acid-binding protein
LISFNQSIAEEAARIRAVYDLHIADAIEIATALNSRATFFLTNDKRLSSVSGIEVLLLDELKEKSVDEPKTDS